MLSEKFLTMPLSESLLPLGELRTSVRGEPEKTEKNAFSFFFSGD